MPTVKGMSADRIAYKNDTYDEMADANRKAATKIKITSKAAGQLSSGYTKLDTPKQPENAHAQTKAERSSVGSSWPGPKGRVGKVLHGSKSPSSAESFLKQKKNHEATRK